MFRERVRILRSMQASILSLEEAFIRLQKDSLPKMSVVITFDDGFFDFLNFGVPTLKEFQAPSTLYLTTYYTKHRLPIISLLLDYVLWKSRETVIEAPEYGIDGQQPIGTYPERQELVRKILAWTEENHLN